MQTRQHIPEIMDDPGLDPAEHEGALRGLRRINRFSRSASAVWKPIARACREANGKTLRVLDLACGGGDVALGIARKAQSAGLPIEIHGADLSEQAVEIARRTAKEQGIDAAFFRLDAVNEAIPPGYDILMSTLFLHHLKESDAVKLLRAMTTSAGRMVLIDDLIRSQAGYALAWAGCRLLSRSRVVHHDGPVSVAGAFRIDEIRRMASAAGIEGSLIQRHWPERFLLSWSRP